MTQTTPTDTAQSTEANKHVIRKLFDEAFNQGNLETVDGLWIPSELESGKRSIVALRSAFPDYHRTIEAQIADGDLVVTRWTARGTHRGPFSSRAQNYYSSSVRCERRLAESRVKKHQIGDALSLDPTARHSCRSAMPHRLMPARSVSASSDRPALCAVLRSE